MQFGDQSPHGETLIVVESTGDNCSHCVNWQFR
jgi:hypothetical protein